MTLHMETELDAATHRADKLPATCCGWDADRVNAISVTLTVWTSPEGDVLNRLADKLRRAADAMEVSR